ncbi:N-formylglutamate amidohydrolase [Asticcacaulis biprosthecium]|uniref:N-formylglutamate amidohydrolase n=1 Tax=Asticcacaulis biprosthecium TaxID=76891 RepID=UPI0035ABC333
MCEHASNHIPSEYHGLGLTPVELTRHIAWDPGAAEVTRLLSQSLNAPAFLGSFSRLLIDLNRPLDSAGSIVTRSEATDIPGNLGLSPEEIARRVGDIFTPYHAAVSAHLDARQGRPTRLVSLHSFTPVFLGVARAWEGGILFGDAAAFGETLVSRLQSAGLRVGANVPYKTDRAEDYAVPVHGDDRGIPAVLVEMRNDLIATRDGVHAWAQVLSTALQE